MRHRWARRILGVLFESDEVEEILRDLEELTRDGRGRRRALAFWTMLCAYPLHEGRERVRVWVDERREGRTMGRMLEDVGFAWRGRRRRPAFALMALLILSVGFGSVVAVHSMVKGVLLDPLPIPEPDRVMTLWLAGERGERGRMSPGHVRDTEALPEVFSGVAAFQGARGVLEDPASGSTTILYGGAVTPAYLRTLGVTPLVGRDFDAADFDVDAESVVLLSHRVWRQMYGEDPDLVGSHVVMDGTRSRVIGILPPGVYPTSASVSGDLPFTDGEADFLELLRFGGDYWTLHGPHLLGAVARLSDGVSAETASAALEVLSRRAAAEYGVNTDETVVMSPLTEEIVGDLRFGLAMLLVTVVLVFLIASANVGSLFLLRAEERRSEVELLGAIGASRGRLLRQRVAEALLVTVPAAALGALAAGWLVEAMRRLVPYQIPRLAEVAVDPVAVLSALVGAGRLAALLGVLPNRRRGASEDVTVRSRMTTGRRQGRAQALLIGGQAGLAVVVLVGALLLTRSFAALQSSDPGYDADETWVFELSGPFEDRLTLVDALRELPGVASASLAYDHPLQRRWGDGFQLMDGVGPGRDTVQQATIRPYGEGYFETVGIRLLQGRIPDRLDHAGELRMAVVNDAFRRAYLGDEVVPGGERVRIPSGDRRLGEGGSAFEIVGVVSDVRFLGPAVPSEPAIYVPFEHFAVGGTVLVVRPGAGAADLLQRVRATMAEVAPGVAVQELGTLGRLRGQALARPRFNMMLLAMMSAVALLLCSLGEYGLVSRTVATRRREIGVRVALGASGVAVTSSVMGRAVKPLAIGAGVGLLVAFGAAGLMESLLYGITSSDPLSLAGAPMILLVIGGLGALVPSLRALSVDSAESLRAE